MPGVTVDLFAGIPVSDYERATAWYERLLGAEPAFRPNEIEAVWEVAEHRFLYIEVARDRAGNAGHTLFVDDLDARVSGSPPRDRTGDDGVVRQRRAQGDLPRPGRQRDRVRRRHAGMTARAGLRAWRRPPSRSRSR